MLNKEFLQFLFEYFAASQTTLFDLTKQSKPKELTAIQYNILEYLYFNEGKGLSTLAECMYLSLPNASREVKKLIEKNLLKKENDPNDKRKSYLFLTTDGLTIMQDTFNNITALLDVKLNALTETEQIKLMEDMKNIKEKLF